MILLPDRLSFDRITDLVWIGSRIVSVRDYERLREAGIAACVDMKREGADPWGFDAFLWLPTPDHEAPRLDHLRMGLSFLRECERARMPVVVSCLAGVGRSCSLVLAHLLTGRFRGAPAQAALDHVASKRPVVRPNPEQIDAARLAACAFLDSPDWE